VGTNVVRIGVDELPDALDMTDQRVRQAIRYGALAGAHRGRALMIPATPTDMGQLRASWKVRELDQALGDVSVTLAELINDAPHVGIVELGSRPHKVSAEGWAAIYEWVRRHYRSTAGAGGSRRYRLGAAGRMKPRGRSSGQPGPFRGDDPEISSITWAIVTLIKRRGTRATLFIYNMLPQLRDALGAEIERAIGKAQREATKGGKP
jgi:hypothetical protein